VQAGRLAVAIVNQLVQPVEGFDFDAELEALIRLAERRAFGPSTAALIDEAVGQLDSDQEEATARELVARKLRATRGLDRDKRIRRLAGMLARKGYSQGLALRVVRQALEEEGEDTAFLDDSC